MTAEQPKGEFVVAVVQLPPVLLDRQATLARAVNAIEEAAGKGARLVALPESFLAGYPFWVWRLRFGEDGAALTELYARLLASAVDLESDQLQPLCDAARKFKVTVVCGINERDSAFS